MVYILQFFLCLTYYHIHFCSLKLKDWQRIFEAAFSLYAAQVQWRMLHILRMSPYIILGPCINPLPANVENMVSSE